MKSLKPVALVIVLAFSFLGALIIPMSKASANYTLIKTEDFNSLNAADWTLYNNTKETRSQAYYMSANTYVNNGSFFVKTRRHCIDSSIDLSVSANRSVINDSTASVAVCPAGTQTIYSSGYLTSKFRQDSGKVEIRAKIPPMQLGYWLGLWLRNECGWNTAPDCYGELDISEIYGNNPTHQTATSHMTVQSGNTKMVQHLLDVANLSNNNWHVFTTEWDPTGIKYYIDGIVVPTTNGNNDGDTSKDTAQDWANKNVSAATFDLIMRQGWETRLEVQVTAPGDVWHNPPDNTIPFNDMLTEIDYIKYYSLNGSTVEPTKLSTPTNIVATPQDGSISLSWTAVPNANNYTVRWGTGGAWTYYSNSSGMGGNPTTNSYTITGLNNGQAYNISIAARDSTGAYTNGDYSASINSTPQAVTSFIQGDINKDGSVNIYDLSILITRWGTSDSLADINNDTVVNISDLSVLISNWTD